MQRRGNLGSRGLDSENLEATSKLAQVCQVANDTVDVE